MAAVTRLGLYGGSRGLYGSFAGKTAQVIADTTPAGGGGSYTRRRKGRYPRRVSIGGRLYWVRNAEEERELLRQWQAQVEQEALELALSDAPAEEVARARVKVVRAARRLDDVVSRETDWLERLRAEDEEILSVLLH